MLPNPNAAAPYANTLNGESGLEDVINSSSATQTPDGVLDPITPGINNGDGRSPEDVDANGLLDRWGSTNIGNAFGIAAGTNPFQAVECFVKTPKVARANKVTGARHVLKLVDGGLGNLPVRRDNGLGGFTVASENPVYIWGNYNSDSTDPFWTNQLAADIPHSAASVIADAVDLLSNSWTDLNSMKNPTSLGNRGVEPPPIIAWRSQAARTATTFNPPHQPAMTKVRTVVYTTSYACSRAGAAALSTIADRW